MNRPFKPIRTIHLQKLQHERTKVHNERKRGKKQPNSVNGGGKGSPLTAPSPVLWCLKLL